MQETLTEQTGKGHRMSPSLYLPVCSPVKSFFCCIWALPQELDKPKWHFPKVSSMHSGVAQVAAVSVRAIAVLTMDSDAMLP